MEKRRLSLQLDRNLLELLREKGAKLHGVSRIIYYCISCAKHGKYV